MLPILNVADAGRYLAALRLDPRTLIASSEQEDAVRRIMADVAERGDDALVESARKFDDPDFTADQIRVSAADMQIAHERVPAELRSALKCAIDQVRSYQRHIVPAVPDPLTRDGVTLDLRWTPLASAGCYFPGGKASYPSSLIHLAVPAQEAGVETVIAATPPSKYGKSDLVLATGHELGLPFMVRAGGAAGIAALAFGTESVPAVDKIVGPGNLFVQIAKRLLSGGVGVDGFLGPSEVLILADESANPAFVAADLLAQAEHDPGSCFLLTDSKSLASDVVAEIEKQFATLGRQSAIRPALQDHSAIFVGEMDELLPLADRFAAEHVNIQTADPKATLQRLHNAGCVFLGPWSSVAAGDYVAGPSHCLPTNTTARFGGGISVFEFLKRTGIVHYNQVGITADAPHVDALANAEGLDAHAASVRKRAEVRSEEL